MNLGVLRSLNYAAKHLKEDIITRGAKTDALHIVLRGEVGIFSNYRKPNQKLLLRLGTGDFFGEGSLLLEQNTHYVSVAMTDVITIALTRRNAVDFIRDEPALTFELMTALVERMRNMDAELVKHAGTQWLSLQTPSEPVATLQTSPADAGPDAEEEAVDANEGMDVADIDFPLFPEGHAPSELPLESMDEARLMEKSYVCPVCKKSFKSERVKPSQLMIERTERDMRNRYRSIEPLYYDVTICPHCLYSALTDMFQKPDKPNAVTPAEISALSPAVKHLFKAKRSTKSIFAGYYLALLCAPVYFMKHESATANLYLKLSRVYDDANDKPMELESTRQALDAYLGVYQNLDLTPPQEQQLSVITAELYLKLEDIKNAKSYFFRAKTFEPATPRLTDHADSRLSDISVIEQKLEQQAREAEEPDKKKKRK